MCDSHMPLFERIYVDFHIKKVHVKYSPGVDISQLFEGDKLRIVSLKKKVYKLKFTKDPSNGENIEIYLHWKKL